MYRYFIIYKPFNVLCQFSPQDGKQTLKDFFPVQQDVYPVGRLDYDSEGLLILTNDTALNHHLLNPLFAHEREYYVQVEGRIDLQAIARLHAGVSISVNGKKHKTLPAKASLFPEPPGVPERNPPIRYRANIPTSWISLTLSEGKNRQVRKMTAQTGFPTLRLIRFRIEQLTVKELLPGQIREMNETGIYRALNIKR